MAATAAEEALGGPGPGGSLAECEGLPWRARMDEDRLRKVERRWATWNFAISAPFFITAAFLLYLEPLLFPVSLWSVSHGFSIPMLYARRGARSIIGLGGLSSSSGNSDGGAEGVALGLLGDLVGHESRDLIAETGLVMERGRLGVWLLGERGAILVRPGGKRVACWCVRIADVEGLPAADRISHLLLALREDECGFATVANLDFSGATRRLRPRLERRARPALDRAVEIATQIEPAPADAAPPALGAEA